MYNPPQQSSHDSSHNVRLYIITITVIIGGIIFLLLLNNNHDGNFSLTSAVVSVKNASLIEKLTDNSAEDTFIEPGVADTHKSSDISFALTSTIIPPVQRGGRFQSLDLTFTDVGSAIKVNNDKLELNTQDQIKMSMQDFTGTMDFDGTKFGLEGTVRKLEVNGIALSSSKDIKISFTNLDYTAADLKGLEVADLEFMGGDGSLTISDQLTYALQQGQSILVDNYVGGMTATRGGETASVFTLKGTASGVDVIGSTLNVNLR